MSCLPHEIPPQYTLFREVLSSCAPAAFAAAKPGAALLAVVLGLSLYLTPERRAGRYVAAHRETLQADMDAYFLRGEPLRYDAPLETVNSWPGEHPMVEYILPALRPGHYGFYYSPDDVPLALQNAAVPLEETADGWRFYITNPKFISLLVYPKYSRMLHNTCALMGFISLCRCKYTVFRLVQKI